MSNIDPQEFGRLQAQVEILLKSNQVLTDTLETLTANVTAMRLEMAEAKGGWRLLMLLGGGAATMGSAATWALTHMFGKGVA